MSPHQSQPTVDPQHQTVYPPQQAPLNQPGSFPQQQPFNPQDVVGDIEQVSALPDTSPGQGPKGGILSIPKVRRTRSSASPHTSPLHTVHPTDPVPTVFSLPRERALRIRRSLIGILIVVIVLVPFIGLFVGVPVGLLLSHVGASLPKSSKIGIGIGASLVGFSLLAGCFSCCLMRL
jgi:hypothetical protein